MTPHHADFMRAADRVTVRLKGIDTRTLRALRTHLRVQRAEGQGEPAQFAPALFAVERECSLRGTEQVDDMTGRGRVHPVREIERVCC